MFQEKELQNKEWKEQADLLKQEQDKEKEEKLKCVQELQTSEERFQKLRDGKKIGSWKLENATWNTKQDC